MIALEKFITRYENINEWKEDIENKEPKLVFVVGTPAAGKTYWMQNLASSFFGNNIGCYLTLDSDHTLQKFQVDHCREVARTLYHIGKEDNSIKDVKDALDDIANESDRVCMENDSPLMNFNLIDLDELMDNIGDMDEKDFENWFYNKYFKDKETNIYNSDFEVRPNSKKVHKLTEKEKIGGTDKDIVIAICGDDLDDYTKRIKMDGSGRRVYVVFLNMPLKNALENDAKRSRHVGEEKLTKKYNDVMRTFGELIKDDKYKELGIWKVTELVPKFYKKQFTKPVKPGDTSTSYKKGKVEHTVKLKDVYDWKTNRVWTNKKKSE